MVGTPTWWFDCLTDVHGKLSLKVSFVSLKLPVLRWGMGRDSGSRKIYGGVINCFVYSIQIFIELFQ